MGIRIGMIWNSVFETVKTPRQYSLVLLSAALGIALSVVAFGLLLNFERDEIREDFERAATDKASTLETTVAANVEAIEDIRSFYQASRLVERVEFRDFVAHELLEHPGIQALEWIPRVPASERAIYEEAARKDGFSEFRIVEREAQGSMMPAEFREVYYPVYYVEPYEGNEAALGFDLASNPVRMEALNKSRDTGQNVATARITLVQESEDQFGFLVFQPIYRNGFAVETLAQRRENLTGFALGVFRIGDMLELAPARPNVENSGPGLDVQLYDRSAPPEQQLLFSTVSANGAAAQAKSRLSFARTISVADRTWELILTSPAEGLSVWSIWQPWVALAGGLLFTGLLSAYLIAALRRTAAVERLVAERTVELSQSNQRLEEESAQRQQVEEHRRNLIAELEEKNAELERFTYTVSHDLKSPLITIKGFLGVLKEDIAQGNNERTQADMARISDGADRMASLLDELLDLSRIGRVVGAREEIPLGEIAMEAVALVAGLAEERKVQVTVADGLPVIFGDRLRIREVLQNLVENAIKFMKEEPDPRVEVGGLQKDGESVSFVRDNGMGIDPRYRQKVFDLFDKLDRNTDGTGIGLALVKRIVEVHGGRVWVESDGLGHGSTFYFALPSKEGASHDEAVQNAR